MSRKRQPKHTRKAAKQKRITPRAHRFSPPPPQQTRPDIKISEAILKISEPLRAQYREPHRMQAIIAIAVMAWNIALFPDEEQSHVQGMLLERLPPQLGGEDVGVLLSTIDTLIARKTLLYPQVREYILTHQLSLGRIGKTNGIFAPASRERTARSPHRHPPADTPRAGVYPRAARGRAAPAGAHRAQGWGGAPAAGAGHAPQDGVG